MPRKAQTKEKFVTLTVEQSTAAIIRRYKFTNEPFYQTWHRVACMFNQSELADTQFLLHESQELNKRQKSRIDQLEAERRHVYNWSEIHE